MRSVVDDTRVPTGLSVRFRCVLACHSLWKEVTEGGEGRGSTHTEELLWVDGLESVEWHWGHCDRSQGVGGVGMGGDWGKDDEHSHTVGSCARPHCEC